MIVVDGEEKDYLMFYFTEVLSQRREKDFKGHNYTRVKIT